MRESTGEGTRERREDRLTRMARAPSVGRSDARWYDGAKRDTAENAVLGEEKIRLSLVRWGLGRWTLAALGIGATRWANDTIARYAPEIARESTVIAHVTTGVIALCVAGVIVRRLVMRFTVSPTHLELGTGVLWRQRINIAIGQVRRVSGGAGPIERMLGIGTIAVWTTGDYPEIVVHGVIGAREVEQGVKTMQR